MSEMFQDACSGGLGLSFGIGYRLELRLVDITDTCYLEELQKITVPRVIGADLTALSTKKDRSK